MGLYPRVLTLVDIPVRCMILSEKHTSSDSGRPCATLLSVAGFYALSPCFLGEGRFILGSYSLPYTLGFAHSWILIQHAFVGARNVRMCELWGIRRQGRGVSTNSETGITAGRVESNSETGTATNKKRVERAYNPATESTVAQKAGVTHQQWNGNNQRWDTPLPHPDTPFSP